jgi:hypothetical protein
MIPADDIHRQQFGVEIVLVGHRREMEERANPVTRMEERLKIANITLEHLVISLRGQWPDIEEAQGEMRAKERHDLRPDAAAGASN